MIKYSVIIPFHSNSNLLTMCISALEKTLDFSESEIVIVDNNATGSQIDSELRLEKKYRIISRKENLMYPRAVNLGAENARGEYLIFCDADTCVTSQFQHVLTAPLKNEGVGYTSAKLLNMQTNGVQEFGITSSYYNFPHPYAGRPLDFPLVSKDHFALAGCAACSSIRRELFISVNGFDTKLVHSYSDIDLCIRLSEIGYKTQCIANAVAYHCGSSTNGSGMGASLKEDTKGIFTAKHPQIPVLITKYIDQSCELLLSSKKIECKDYFILDCSTIGNSELYIDRIVENLNLSTTARFRYPYHQRDALFVDYINFIPYMIRDYRVSMFYFVDNFLSFRNNVLWKSCRENYNDIVADRNANIEFLKNI